MVDNDIFADLVFGIVKRDRKLPFRARDDKGRPAINIASGECRRRMLEAIFVLGRYELLGEKHRSATCAVVFASDHAAGAGGGGAAAGVAEGSGPRPCVLKLMRHRSQWDRELAARGGCLEEAEGGGSSAAAAATAAAPPRRLRFLPQHVMPVLRRHDLSGEAESEALEDGLRDFPFVLVLPRGEEDLHGTNRCCH